MEDIRAAADLSTAHFQRCDREGPPGRLVPDIVVPIGFEDSPIARLTLISVRQPMAVRGRGLGRVLLGGDRWAPDDMWCR
ncbi:hypothetical protein ABZS88_43525 [Streptomyces sp. NPDC005480]|uniref:hypothetical protein n=1 Tax=Streptomyces sp. NPDC005480 TaxID=3154880 RepID=UPI0033BACF44